jgi:tetratricopeptide (TPR) repeat protein
LAALVGSSARAQPRSRQLRRVPLAAEGPTTRELQAGAPTSLAAPFEQVRSAEAPRGGCCTPWTLAPASAAWWISIRLAARPWRTVALIAGVGLLAGIGAGPCLAGSRPCAAAAALARVGRTADAQAAYLQLLRARPVRACATAGLARLARREISIAGVLIHAGYRAEAVSAIRMARAATPGARLPRELRRFLVAQHTFDVVRALDRAGRRKTAEQVLLGGLVRYKRQTPPGGVPPDMQLLLHEAAEKGGGKSFLTDFASSLGSVVRDIVKWVLIATAVAVGVAVLALARWLYRQVFRLRGKTTVSITDLAAEPKERNVKNHVLTRDLVDEVYSATGGSEANAAAEIDESRDLDGTSLPLIRIADGTELIGSLISDETPVKFGPIALSPRQLVDFVRWYVGRRGDYEIRGSLRTDGGRSALTVERVATYKTNRSLNRWHAVYDGDDSRAKAILDVATRIAVDLGGSYVTADWQSFREYRDAMAHMRRAMRDDARVEALEEARAAFQRSLEYDPLSVLARFNLGSVQRMLGQNEEAVANFRLLERLATTNLGRLSPTGRAFVRRHPEFLYIATYNRAVALSKIPRWDCHNSARRALALLVAELSESADVLALDEDERHLIVEQVGKAKQLRASSGEPQVEEAERERLELLARAAWASTLVFQAENSEGRRELVLKKIQEVRSWTEQRSAASDDPRVAGAFHQAQSTVDNANGRVLFLLGRFDEAREAVQDAVVLLPAFGDAYVNMASILMAKGARTPGWQTRAEHNLKRALKVSPLDERALVLLGDLYTEVRRYNEAEEQFRKLPEDPLACFKLGELLARKGNQLEAIEMFSRSLSQRPAANYRADLFVAAVLKLAAHDDSVTAERLGEALIVAKRLAKRGTPPRLQRRGDSFVIQIEDMITARRLAAAAPPASAGRKQPRAKRPTDKRTTRRDADVEPVGG